MRHRSMLASRHPLVTMNSFLRSYLVPSTNLNAAINSQTRTFLITLSSESHPSLHLQNPLPLLPPRPKHLLLLLSTHPRKSHLLRRLKHPKIWPRIHMQPHLQPNPNRPLPFWSFDNTIPPPPHGILQQPPHTIPRPLHLPPRL